MDLSQNGEASIIENYFGDHIGTLCSLGENDGQTISNVFGLLQRGWSGTLLEPSPKAFLRLQDLYAMNERVYCMNVAVGDINGYVDFQDSGNHIGENDTSLLSTASEWDYNKWKDSTVFEKIKVPMVTFNSMLEQSPYKTFDLLSCDIEGFDIIALRQMDLKMLSVKCVCIEHNGIIDIISEIRSICKGFGLNNELAINSENIILAF